MSVSMFKRSFSAHTHIYTRAKTHSSQRRRRGGDGAIRSVSQRTSAHSSRPLPTWRLRHGPHHSQVPCAPGAAVHTRRRRRRRRAAAASPLAAASRCTSAAAQRRHADNLNEHARDGEDCCCLSPPPSWSWCLRLQRRHALARTTYSPQSARDEKSTLLVLLICLPPSSRLSVFPSPHRPVRLFLHEVRTTYTRIHVYTITVTIMMTWTSFFLLLDSSSSSR